MGAMGRKKNRSNSKEYSLFREGVLNSFEIQRKFLILQKKEIISDINKRCEIVKSACPSDVLQLKLGDLVKYDSSKSVQNQLLGSSTELRGREYRKIGSNYTITSKVNPYLPVSMLRVPNKGEFAVSASGSPLQMTCLGSDTATINIPLRNGTVMAVLPQPGINTNVIQENLEPSVKKQLETLRNAICEILHVS